LPFGFAKTTEDCKLRRRYFALQADDIYMNKEKARAVLEDELRKYRAKPYAALKDMIGQVDAYQITTLDGLAYQIEIQILWDGKPDADIRVIGAIDDGGWAAFSPSCDDFIMTPAETFLDE